MEDHPVREEEDGEEDEGALAKSPLQLTTDDEIGRASCRERVSNEV